MVFQRDHVIALIGWTSFVMFSKYSMTREDVTWYEEESARKKLWLVIPSFVFPIVWFLLDGFEIVSLYFFWDYAVDYTTVTFLGAFISAFVNIILCKQWSATFFGWRREGTAFMISFLLFATSVMVLFFMGFSPDVIDGPLNMKWLPFGLYFAKPVWLTIAMLYNLMWIGGCEGLLKSWNSLKIKISIGKKHRHHHHDHESYESPESTKNQDRVIVMPEKIRHRV